MTGDELNSVKPMRLRYAGTCRECGTDLPAGSLAAYDRAANTVICVGCMPGEFAAPAFNPGTAGASAQREFERRKANREIRTREAHPHLGGLILALTDVPQGTTAWETGARGEVLLGNRLDKLVERGIHVLHDRRIPGTRANIDHLVVGTRGVFVIDAKRYKGRPRLQVEGGLFRPRTEKLMVGSRDCTGLVSGVRKQMRLVESSLAGALLGDIPIFGMLCFVEADWPLIGGSFAIDEVDVLWPRMAIAQMDGTGPLDASSARAAFRALALYFPPA
jgi:hypothetical protein